MRTPRSWTAVVAAVMVAAAPSRAPAQGAAAVRLTARLAADSTSSGSRAPIVRSENLLGDGRWMTALRSGLPVRLHYTVEVWRSRGGWFDAFEREAEWDVVLRHEPLLDQYTVLTLVGGRAQERRYATVDALSAALAFAYQVSVRPAQPGRYYYAASLEISTLSDSDLDELQRFLEGDLEGVAQGKEGVGDAVGRGATRFLLRLAGLPSLRLEVRSLSFQVR
ncbi:MAG TPA: DUF4390 domain-containing protein [Gemmatimonadales bacterium]|nr:DUF4390 domain-containing protein [Gemmatimonadales bacterium]